MSDKLPEKYIEFIKGIELRNLELLKCSLKRDEGFIPEDISLKIQEKPPRYRKTDNGFIAYVSFSILAEKETGEKFTVEASYRVIYESKTPITKTLFEIFSTRALVLHAWPYFRQLVHDFTLRTGLPPLVLPVIKMVK